LDGLAAVPHERLRELHDGRGRGADPGGVRRGEVRSAQGVEARVRPGERVPHEPEHPARVSMSARATRAEIAADAFPGDRIRIALIVSGAVSLGSYEAGALS